MTISQWSRALNSVARIALDTNAVIYGLDTHGAYRPLMLQAFQSMQLGRLSAVVSRVVEVETLVLPLREGDRASLDVFERFFHEMPGLILRDVDARIARRAAEIRAKISLRLPDAIVAATALEERCDAIVGNDERFARRMTGLPYLLLDDYVP